MPVTLKSRLLLAAVSPVVLVASHALAADAGGRPADAAAPASRDAGSDAATSVSSKPATTNPHAAGADPHGGQAADPTGQGAAADVVEEDATLPAGTIDVEVRDPSDMPRTKVSVTLGIVQNSVAKGESRRQLVATTNELGRVRWDKLEVTSQMAYRVSVAESGGQFAARPFQLDPKKGMRVVLHTYPVTSDISQAVVVMQSIVYVELKDDRVQIQQAFNVFNFGKTAWAPRDFLMPLPSGFTALTSVQQMSDQTVETDPVGARVKGTFAPGRHSIEYKWQLPYSEDPSVDFSIGMPPNVAAARVMIVSAGEMKASVDGFPPPRAGRDAQGNAIVETEREMRREEPQLTTLRVRLSEIPTPGLARHVTAAIAALGVAMGLSFLFKKKGDPSRKKRDVADRKRDRARLLHELAELERARRTGDVGPRTYENARRELIDALARTLASEAIR